MHPFYSIFLSSAVLPVSNTLLLYWSTMVKKFIFSSSVIRVARVVFEVTFLAMIYTMSDGFLLQQAINNIIPE